MSLSISSLLRASLLAGVLGLLSACGAATGTDERAEFAARNEGRTLIAHSEALGTQVVYLAPGGKQFTWSAAAPLAQSGAWKYELLATGTTTTYQGTGVINQQVAAPESAWGICVDAPIAAQTPPPPESSDGSCLLLSVYEAQISERIDDDIFDLQSGKVPAPLPPGRRLSSSDLVALR